MPNLIATAVEYKRTVLMLAVLVIISGIVSYILIPKEEGPDVNLPLLYVSTSLEGISPDDADKLLATPIVRELKSIDGLNKITSTGSAGHTGILLEFDSDVDIETALVDVREQVDKASLPADAREPSITEINIALFPILVITLSGDVDETVLFRVAENIQEKLESLPGVLEANIKGDREEFAEVIVNPYLMEAYNLDINEVIRLIAGNNRLVAAGALDTGQGRFSVRVPGLLEDERDIVNFPIKVVNGQVLTYKDLAIARRTYKDPTSYSRFNGKPTVSLEIVKRIGENSIHTIEDVKGVMEEERTQFPDELSISYSSDASVGIRESLDNLFNNVLSAAILVMLLAILFIGFRSATLVGLSIPCSFLAAIFIINLMGYTLNIVVLFALILSLGMLVDGAIVVAEFADMRMAQGIKRQEAYIAAARRMSWPIITSTATTLAAFFPLLFWPDIIGKFMSYIPITVITTLSCALIVALVVLPVVGAIIGKPNIQAAGAISARLEASERGEYEQMKGWTGAYVRMIDKCIQKPIRVCFIIFLLFITIILGYMRFGNGVEFFPNVEPDIGIVKVRARGDLSLLERDAIVRQVEEEILRIPELKTVYTTVGIIEGRGADGANQDLIGNIQIEFIDWIYRPPAREIIKRIDGLAPKFPGIVIETKTEEAGPPSNADIEVELGSNYKNILDETVDKIVEYIDSNVEGVRSIRSTRSLPSIAWEVNIDREQASKFNIDTSTLGSFIQMITDGVKVSDYLPEGAQDELDIRLRFPANHRNIGRLENMRISSADRQIPISNFIERRARPRENQVTRINGNYAYNLEIDLERGYRPDQKIPEITAILNSETTSSVVNWQFRGEQENQQEAAAFLMRAFGIAFFIMLTILVTQFNSFGQALLVLSAIFFSTAGVFLGLLIRNEPFGIVMSGVGVIALAGIVVNNNIILIDTFNRLIKEGISLRDAILQTCTQRFRPVILTSITTIMGLLPMVLQININWLSREVTIGAPSTQWWVQLSTAIAGGLFFATIITLFFTPSMLYLSSLAKERKKAKRSASITAQEQPV